MSNHAIRPIDEGERDMPASADESKSLRIPGWIIGAIVALTLALASWLVAYGSLQTSVTSGAAKNAEQDARIQRIEEKFDKLGESIAQIRIDMSIVRSRTEQLVDRMNQKAAKPTP